MSRANPVEPAYTDAFGERRRVSPKVRREVAAAMAPGAAAGPRDAVRIAHPGDRLARGGLLVLEDGTDLGRVTRLPADMPFGYHRLLRGEADQLLIVGPGRCHLPATLREWGVVVQLATLRSRRSWGVGDLGDLRDLAAWASDAGAGFLAVSPLGAPNPGPEPEASPYYPSTRRFLNPLHLSVEEVSGAEALEEASTAGRALNAMPLVERPRILAAKLAALERVWKAHRVDREGLRTFRRERGVALQRWATFAVLCERLGPGWQEWPRRYRDPDGAAVAAVAAEAGDRIGFHCWVQMLLDGQLAAASRATRRIADMPVGVDPGGFDAWDWQGQLALDASIGAPPDRFNTAGQSWGLPPFVPDRLRAERYRPFVETLRAQLRHAGGLRIDHVLGLFRLWCIPSGSDPAQGAYVRYPTDELLEIVALESHRARAVVIGEDLGTVPAGVRRELRRRRILSTRLVLFERVPPPRYPRQSFAAVTTHDLPTIAGLWSGEDDRDQGATGATPDPRASAHLRRRVARAAGVEEDTPFGEVVERVHRRLATAPSMLVAATLEDALGVERRPNLPGTVSAQRSNWSVPLPLPLEDLVRDRRVGRLVAALKRPTPGAAPGRRAGGG